MSTLHSIYYMFVELSIKIFVKSKIISDLLSMTGKFNIKQPILYILPSNSTVDLFTLRYQCLKKGLPDPLKPLCIGNIILPRYIFIKNKNFIGKKIDSLMLLRNYLDIIGNLSTVSDIHMISVFVMFGRNPGRELTSNKYYYRSRWISLLHKCISVLWFGRDSFIFFSNPLSLRSIVLKYGITKTSLISEKLIRVYRIHFVRQSLVAVGPRLPRLKDIFSKILTSKSVEKVLEDEIRNKNCSIEQVQNNAIFLIKEIAANFSYEAIRISDRVLSWILNRFYHGLHIYNVDRVLKIAKNGHEIVYIPCHRSHIDYLLVSYILYQHGLVPPHIAAGINLNFWPAGQIFRRLGAFFIRRTFNKNKIYSTIFREYFRELLTKGYSVEYFIEGSRSRTGRLLEPKTGMLTMTIQAMLCGVNRTISLIPIYVGYDNVMEVSSYSKELKGISKKKEGFIQMIKGLRNLRNLGQGYINFGEPLSLNHLLTTQVPQWNNFIEKENNTIDKLQHRPIWLSMVVNNIATSIMVRINNAAIVNAINLCSSVLLVSNKYSLSKQQFISQLTCYIDLLRNVPYSKDIILPKISPESILEYALSMNKVNYEKNRLNCRIFLSKDQARLMLYYKNNIQHLLILPSLIANIVKNQCGISYENLYKSIKFIYPMIKAELFIRFSKYQLTTVIDKLIFELQRQGIMKIVKNRFIYPVQKYIHTLQLLENGGREMLQLYAITFYLLRISPYFNREKLKNSISIIAQRVSMLHSNDDFNGQEYGYNPLLSTRTIIALRDEGYIIDNFNIFNEKVNEMCEILSKLVSSEVLTTIENYCIISTSVY